METARNMASSAYNAGSKMIYGEGQTESGQEPVSGQQGEGTKTEPFDAGNKGEDVPSSTNDSSSAPAPATTESTVGSEPSAGAAVESSGDSQPSTGATAGTVGGSEPNTGTAVESSGDSKSSTGAAAGTVGDSDPNTGTALESSGDSKPSTSAAAGTIGDSDPNTGTDVTKSQTPQAKQQGADKPMDEPTGEQEGAVKEKKDEGEAAMSKRDPNDHSGEPLHVHDGSEKKEDNKAAGGGPPTSEEESKAEGTGEQWVKTSGLAADGGDFDATKPGAAREADRILEEKGVHKSEPNKGAPTDIGGGSSASGGDAGPGKTSKMDKLKDKLHIGHKS